MAHATIVTYIYHLPHTERKTLCRLLDRNNRWEELGEKYMNYDQLTIQDIGRGALRGTSPTEELLTMWGQQNHTVEELFILLYKMKHYQAMMAIKDYVDVKYHVLIRDGKTNLNCLINNLRLDDADDSDHSNQVKNCPVGDAKLLNLDDPRNHPVKVILPAGYQLELSEEDNQKVLPEVKNQPKSPLMAPSRLDMLTDMSTVVSSAGAIPQITYVELQKATNDWDKASILGKGGFGTVFKGIWKCTQVAIKRLDQRGDNNKAHCEQMKQSITELQCLNAYRHDNILALYGYSIDGPQHCLVYQYMAGGCLEHRLHVKDPNKVLDWFKRLNIAIGTARGLQFLHTIGDKPLIHGDIKSANVLLDPCDTPKIGDFGLAKEGPQSTYTHVTLSRSHGTKYYVADEFLRSKRFSTKIDTYSFGIVLFELATGCYACSYDNNNKNKRVSLKERVLEHHGDPLELKDPRATYRFNGVIGGEANAIAIDGGAGDPIAGDDCFHRLLSIGKVCVSKRPKDRPEMVNVLRQLEGRHL